MVKYKCNDCGKTFKGDYSTKACPECKSENISEVTSLFANKTNRILLGVTIAVAVLTIVALCIFMKPSTIEATLKDDETSVIVTVTGVSVDDLEELYQVQVYTEEGESHDILYFKDEASVSYDKYMLLPGRCYTFELEKIGGGKIDNLNYPIENRRVCIPSIVTPYPPQISEISIGNSDRRTMKYNGVVVKMDKPGDYSYQIINNKGITIATQESNVFNRLAPGDYIAKVTNKEGVESSKPFTLPEIAVDNITLTKAQKIFDKLSKHEIKIGEARSALATVDVELANPVDECKMLFAVLQEVDLFGTEFKVVSFDVDDSGRIKSGTLVLIRIK